MPTSSRLYRTEFRRSDGHLFKCIGVDLFPESSLLTAEMEFNVCVGGYIPRWFARLQTVITHSSTNHARCKATNNVMEVQNDS